MMQGPKIQAALEAQSLSVSPGAHKSSTSKGWYWVILALLFVGGGTIAWWQWGRSRPSQAPMGFGPIAVELMELESRQIEERSAFVGVMEAQQGVMLKPEVDGQVVQVFVSSGDQVNVGDPVFRLSPDRSQAEVNTAIANTNISRAALTNAQAQFRAAQAEQVRAQAEVDLQNQEIDRTRELVAEGAQAQQQLDIAIRNRDTAIASLEAANERIQSAQAAIEQAEAALQQAQSQVEIVQSDLADTLISAPISGTVGDIPIKLGDFVEVGDDLTTVVQNQTLDLSLAVPIEYREQLQLGLPVQVNNFGNQAIEGQINFISPQVNPTTQTVTVEAAFDNSLRLLNDDQRVEASIIWEEHSGVLVPATAITRLAGQSFVFVAIPSTDEETGESQLIAQQRSVTLGAIQGNDYQVLDGLKQGESIVISGILNLSNGDAIAPKVETEEAEN